MGSSLIYEVSFVVSMFTNVTFRAPVFNNNNKKNPGNRIMQVSSADLKNATIKT